MILARLVFNPEQVQRMAEQEMEKRMKKAMNMLEGKTKQLVSRGNKSGDNPSKPGEPPKVVTGTLRSNIANVVVKEGRDIIGILGVRKGPADKYSMRLELGFKGTDSLGRKYDQKERPYLRAALAQNRNKVEQILKEG